jgi:hypothetical protein
MLHNPELVLNKIIRKEQIQTPLCMNAKRVVVYINGLIFPHSFLSLEAGT